jgi:predicted nucleotidyltransferase
MEKKMATMTTENILMRLRALKPEILQKFRAKEIQLFGSNIRNFSITPGSH